HRQQNLLNKGGWVDAFNIIIIPTKLSFKVQGPKFKVQGSRKVSSMRLQWAEWLRVLSLTPSQGGGINLTQLIFYLILVCWPDYKIGRLINFQISKSPNWYIN